LIIEAHRVYVFLRILFGFCANTPYQVALHEDCSFEEPAAFRSIFIRRIRNRLVLGCSKYHREILRELINSLFDFRALKRLQPTQNFTNAIALCSRPKFCSCIHLSVRVCQYKIPVVFLFIFCSKPSVVPV